MNPVWYQYVDSPAPSPLRSWWRRTRAIAPLAARCRCSAPPAASRRRWAAVCWRWPWCWPTRTRWRLKALRSAELRRPAGCRDWRSIRSVYTQQERLCRHYGNIYPITRQSDGSPQGSAEVKSSAPSNRKWRNHFHLLTNMRRFLWRLRFVWNLESVGPNWFPVQQKATCLTGGNWTFPVGQSSCLPLNILMSWVTENIRRIDPAKSSDTCKSK